MVIDMAQKNTLEQKIITRISHKKSPVILRKDFKDLPNYNSIVGVLKTLIAKCKIIKIGMDYIASAINSLINNFVGSAANQCRRKLPGSYFAAALRISFALLKVAKQLSSGWPCL